MIKISQLKSVLTKSTSNIEGIRIKSELLVLCNVCSHVVSTNLRFTAVTAASARFASVLQEGILEELESFCHTTIRMSMLAVGLDTTDALREEALNGMLVCVMGHTSCRCKITLYSNLE